MDPIDKINLLNAICDLKILKQLFFFINIILKLGSQLQTVRH